MTFSFATSILSTRFSCQQKRKKNNKGKSNFHRQTIIYQAVATAGIDLVSTIYLSIHKKHKYGVLTDISTPQ